MHQIKQPCKSIIYKAIKCPGLDSLCVDCYAITMFMGAFFLIYK